MSYQMDVARSYDETKECGSIEGRGDAIDQFREYDAHESQDVLEGHAVIFLGSQHVSSRAYDVETYLAESLGLPFDNSKVKAEALSSISPAESHLSLEFPWTASPMSPPLPALGEPTSSASAASYTSSLVPELGRSVPHLNATPPRKRQIGWIHCFNPAKGLGLIRGKNGLMYLFHRDETTEDPVLAVAVAEGTRVDFDTTSIATGHNLAYNVREKKPIPKPGPLQDPDLQRAINKARTDCPPSSSAASAIRGNKRNAKPPKKPLRRPITKLGYVRFYYHKKEYGFILGSGGEDCFFTRSALLDDDVIGLEGSVVMFQITECRKGLQACLIRRADVALDLDTAALQPELLPSRGCAQFSAHGFPSFMYPAQS